MELMFIASRRISLRSAALHRATVWVGGGRVIWESSRHEHGPGSYQVRIPGHQSTGRGETADLALAIPGFRGVFRVRPRHSQRDRKLLKQIA